MRTRLAILFAIALPLFAIASCSSGGNGSETLPIGSPCTNNQDCGPTASFYCDKKPLGYCTKACASDGECPPEAICAFDGMSATGVCHAKCTVKADCRAQYNCKPASTNPASRASHGFCDSGDVPLPMDASTSADLSGG